MASLQTSVATGRKPVFTVVLAERRNNHLLVERIELLMQVVREVQERHPFRIHGWVVLPEHLHALLELPVGIRIFQCAGGK